MQKHDLITIRDWDKPLDEPFIFTTWRHGLYDGSSWFGAIKKAVYNDNYGRVISAILSRPETTARIACLKDDPSVILGYAVLNVARETILHWVYVREAWRNIGIMSDLIPTNTTTCTHLTHRGKQINRKRLEFNPFKI